MKQVELNESEQQVVWNALGDYLITLGVIDKRMGETDWSKAEAEKVKQILVKVGN